MRKKRTVQSLIHRIMFKTTSELKKIKQKRTIDCAIYIALFNARSYRDARAMFPFLWHTGISRRPELKFQPAENLWRAGTEQRENENV